MTPANRINPEVGTLSKLQKGLEKSGGIKNTKSPHKGVSLQKTDLFTFCFCQHTFSLNQSRLLSSNGFTFSTLLQPIHTLKQQQQYLPILTSPQVARTKTPHGSSTHHPIPKPPHRHAPPPHALRHLHATTWRRRPTRRDVDPG